MEMLTSLIEYDSKMRQWCISLASRPYWRDGEYRAAENSVSGRGTQPLREEQSGPPV